MAVAAAAGLVFCKQYALVTGRPRAFIRLVFTKTKHKTKNIHIRSRRRRFVFVYFAPVPFPLVVSAVLHV